jgi:hypothetical protein
MRNLTDSVAPTDDAELDELARRNTGLVDTFGQGLRVGGLTAAGQANTLAGKAMGAAGYDGSGRLAAGTALQADAQQAGQGLTQLGDVRDVSSGLRWAAGAIGASAPMAGAATIASLAGGRTAAGRMMGGTLAMAPFEMGEQLQRQDADPVASQLSPGQQLGASVLPAGGAALVQNMVPAGVAARLGGYGASTTGKQIIARGLADIPAEGLAEGAGEGIRQWGLNEVNPNAGYDTDAIQRSAIEGAALGGVFGTVGAAGEAAHKYGGAVAAAPGRAIEAAKGLVPEKAQERAGEAVDAAQAYAADGFDKASDAAGKAAEWFKGTINQRTADVKAWGEKFMADEAAPDSFKAQVQEAMRNPGDKAKAVWLATEKFARDGAATVKTAVDEADIPTRLRELGERAKKSTAGLRDKVAGGQEIADPAELEAAIAAGPEAAAEVFAKADKTAMERAREWGSELMKEGLTPEKTEQLKQWMATASDKASQQGIAALHAGQEKVKEVGSAIEKFAGKAKGNVKKSEVSTEATRSIGGAVSRVLGADHPALSDPKMMNKLAEGLRGYINDVADGKTFDSFDMLDRLEALHDVAGDKTSALLKAVHTAVSGAGKQDTALFKTLNEIDAITKGRQGLTDTLQKNLRPMLQSAVRPSELKVEAAMLKEWARSKVKEPGDVEKAKFNDNQVRSALNLRYEKPDVVMKAVEASVKSEQNMIDAARVKTPLDSDEAGVKEDGDPRDAGVREGVVEDELSKSKYYAQKGQLYLSPEKDKGKAGFEGAAAQKLKRAQKENPNSVVRFVSAKELGMEDAAVKAKYEDLLDAGETLGMSPAEARDYADKRIEDFGVVVAEESKQETAITDNELDKVRLDAKKYGTSKSRIDASDDLILDAAKLTEFMQGKLKGDYAAGDDAGRPARQARMFMEGVAAVQDRIGKAFEISDETVITKGGMTWGQARKLDGRSDRDKAYDAASAKLVAQRQAYKTADMDARKKMTADARKTLDAREQAVVREQLAESDPPDMTAGPLEKDPFGPTFDALEGRGKVKVTDKGGATNVRQPPRSFAQTVKDVGIEVTDEGDTKAVIRTNADGTARGDTVMGRRKPAKSVNPEVPPSPKALAAKKAALLKAASSGNPALTKELRSSSDAKALQRAAMALPSGAALDAANARLSELVQDPDVAYGLQTKKYNMEAAVIHAALGQPGFAAAHNSPHKFDGVFDWRTHALKGEGQMVKGAGTYLSTSDQVHGYYKAMFGGTLEYNAVKALKNSPAYKALAAELDALYKTGIVPAEKTKAVMDKMFAMEEALPKAKPPTYHLSVEIEPEQIMDWDKPLSKQSDAVKAAALKAAKDFSLGNPFGGVDDVLNERGEDFYRELSDRMQPGSPEAGDRAASDYLQAAGVLGHRMKASSKDGAQNPNYVIYDDSKIRTNYVHFDKQGVTAGAAGPVDRKAVMDYVQRVHGNSVAVAWANIMHAGEFERTSLGDVMRLSVHSLNPQSVAYHEALHGLFAKLNDAKQGDIRAVLEKAGSSAAVMNQLKVLLANEPAALAQLTDPEERAAYMYQFWAQDKLTVGPKVDTIFQRIAKFLREVTGLLTNDERALQILEYFHSGEYNANRSNPNAVHRALMQGGLKGVYDKLDKMTEPLQDLANTIAVAGGERLRDTGIPALRELANAMKLKGTSEGTDAGFLPASRLERSRVMNAIGKDLKPYSEAELNEALEALQNGTQAKTANAFRVQTRVSQHLADMLKYMQDAGVEIDALGLTQGADYFPRSWDAGFIAAHKGEFLAMLEKYVLSGELKGDPKKILETLMVTDGHEFGIEVDKPGMQNAKQRVLAFIKHADAAPFMRKDMYQILNSYVTQATRRAEWARRFGDVNDKGVYSESQRVNDLMAAAKKQGATPAQMKAAQDFVRAVDGTLGDTISPELRRLQGNVIVYENIRLLPLAIFSSVVDPLGITVRGGSAGNAFSALKRGVKEVVKNFQKDQKSDGMTNLAEAIGTIDNAMLVQTMGASYSQGMVGDTGRKINDTFFRYNLMEQWNRSMRVAATEAALQFISRHATQPNQHSARYLKELGLTPADVQAFNGRAAVLESEGLTADQSAKMKAAVNRWVDTAILRPDAVDKPPWMSDPHWALVSHLKQFVFSFHETILKRVAHEAKNGNYTPAMALASYVPMMIAADLIKGVIQGGGEQPPWKDGWTMGDYMMSGVERSGMLGVSQFGLDVLQDAQRGGSGIGALSGPAIEQLVDAIGVVGGNKQFGPFALKSMPANALYAGAVRGESTDPDFTN